MKKAAARTKRRYDLHVCATVPEVGDLVLVRLIGTRKFVDKCKSGSYYIIQRHDPNMPVYVAKVCDGLGGTEMDIKMRSRSIAVIFRRITNEGHPISRP